MARTIDIRQYQPDLMKDVLEFKALADAENPELQKQYGDIGVVFDNQFVDTLTEYGCKRWEKGLGITPKASDTLEDRRFRIKTRMNDDLPYTMRTLGQMLDALCGAGNYEKTLYHLEYRLKVLLELTAKKQFDEAKDMLSRILPANMILELGLRYNTWGQAAHLTWGQVSHMTWKQIREEVIPDNGTTG